jgi:hypothetical protein
VVQRRARICTRWPKKWAAKNTSDANVDMGQMQMSTQRINLGTDANVGREQTLVCWDRRLGVRHNRRRRLRESVRRKRPQLWLDNWIPHHGNALAYDMLRVHEFLATISITKTNHPPHSSDLAPFDFWLFPESKNALKGKRFADFPDI